MGENLKQEVETQQADQRTMQEQYAKRVWESNRGSNLPWRVLMALYSIGLIGAVMALLSGHWHLAVLILVAFIVVSLL